MESFECPLGFRFVPTDNELALYYLRRKLDGLTLPPSPLTECDLYGHQNPWDLFHHNSDEFFYVFTKLKKRKKSAIRILRTAGWGTWKARNKTQVRDQDGRVLWFKKDFLFEVNKKNSSSTDNGHWLMTELSLHDDEVANTYVLCRNKHCKNSHKEKKEIIEEEELSALEYEASVMPSLQKKRKFSGEEGEEDQSRMRMAPMHSYSHDSELVDYGIYIVEVVPLSAQVPTQDTVTEYGPGATSEESYPIPIVEETAFHESLIAEQVSIPEYGVVPEYPMAEENPIPEYRVVPDEFPIAEEGRMSGDGDLTTLFSEIDEESRRALDTELDRLVNEFAPDIALQQNEFTPPPLTHLSAASI